MMVLGLLMGQMSLTVNSHEALHALDVSLTGNWVDRHDVKLDAEVVGSLVESGVSGGWDDPRELVLVNMSSYICGSLMPLVARAQSL